MANIEILDNTGIVCDNPDCDFSDKTVSLEEIPNWLNKECPKCGENLLTEEDLDIFEKLLQVIGIVNEMDLPEDEDNKHTKFEVTTHKEIVFKEIN